MPDLGAENISPAPIEHFTRPYVLPVSTDNHSLITLLLFFLVTFACKRDMVLKVNTQCIKYTNVNVLC